MLRLKRWGLIVLLILLGLEILTIAPSKLGGPVTKVEKQKTIEEKAVSAVQTTSHIMAGVHLTETGPQGKIWELDAQGAQNFKDKGNWKLQGVKAHFFGSGGSVYTVTGDRGVVQLETKNMQVEGHVVMSTSEGYTMRTRAVTYDAKAKVLATPEDVVMDGPKSGETPGGKFEMAGRDFRAEMDSSLMTLKENVRAEKSVGPTNKMMTIKSVWTRINGKTNDAHFEENVQVDMDDARMTGNQADFDYDPNTKILTSLTMQGNVRVTDQRHWAASQKARVLFAQDEFKLWGNPRVLQDENELRGEEITFLKGGKEVRVIRAKARMENQPKEFMK